MERKNLREAREKKNWSQEELAEYVGVNRRETISEWERGITYPYPRHRRKLGELFDIEDVSELLKIVCDDAAKEERPCTDTFDDSDLEQGEGTDERMVPTVESPPQLDASEDNTTEGETHESMAPTAKSLSEPDQNDTTSSHTSIVLFVPSTVEKFVLDNLERRLWHIAHTNYSDPSEMTAAIQQAIKEFTMMNTGHPTYEITRREAICSLASLPMTTLGKNPTVHTKHYGEMLMHCTAALEACWQLYRGSDAIGTKHAFDCVCTYVPLLETITKDSAQYQKQALDLATRYALLKTLLGGNCARPREAVGYARNALDFSKETGDILLQLSAYTKLNWTYLRSRKYTKAWETMQEGEHVLQSHQRKKNRPPLLSGMIGNFYSGYSLAQVNNGISPDTALGIATDSEPLKGHMAFVEFTESSQWLEAARICSAKGDPTQAMIWIGKRIDLETLAPRVPQSEQGRIQALNTMTNSLLQSKERNMEKIIEICTAGIEGAKALKHEVMYQEAMTNFEIMRALYPGEQRIMKLIPLTEHW